MAKDAEIKLVLNTQQALKDARAFGPELKKALDVQGELKGVEEYQQKLHQLAIDNKWLTDDSKFKTKGIFDPKNIDKAEAQLGDLFTIATRLASVNERLRELGIDDNVKKVSSEDYPEESKLLEERNNLETVLATKLKEQEATYKKIETKAKAAGEIVANNAEAVYAVNLAYEQAANAALSVETSTEKSTESAGELEQKLEDTQSATDGVSDAVDKTTAGLENATDAASELKSVIAEESTSDTDATTTATATEQEEQSLKDLIVALHGVNEELVAFQKTGKDTADVEQQIADISSRINEVLNFDASNASIADLVAHHRELLAAKKAIEKEDMPTDLRETYDALIPAIVQTKVAIDSYMKALNAVAKGTDNAKQSTKSLNANVKTSSKEFTNIAKSASKFAGVIRNGFRDMSRNSTHVKSAFNRMSNSMRSNFKHLIGNITKYVFGFRSLFFLVRRLRQYVGEGIKNMAQFNNGSNAVNRNITALLSSLLYLKNAWATAFSPILGYVTPTLTYLIDKLAEAGNAFSRFLGVLLGQETVFQAVKVKAGDYADSLDKTAGSAGSAEKALRAYLSPLDELNRMDDPNKGSSGGGGGLADAYEPDPNEMFKIVESQNELAERIKEAWEKADFTELGAMLKNKIIDALNIDWSTVQEGAEKIGTSLGTFLSGLLGDPALYESIGRTAGNAINTISKGIQSLLNQTKNIKFGENLGKGLNEFLKTTDFELAGKNVGDLIKQITENIDDFVKTIDKDEVVNAITNFIDGLDIGEITAMAKELTLDVVKLVLEVGSDLIVHFGEKLGDKLFNDASNGIKSSIDGKEIVLEPKFSVTEEPIKALGDTILTGIGNFVIDIPFTLTAVLEYSMKDKKDLTKMEFIDALSEAWSDVFSFKGRLKDKTPINKETGGVDRDAEIEERIKQFSEVGDASIDMSDTVKGSFKDMQTNISQTLTEIAGNLATKWVEIKLSAQTRWEDIKNKVAEKVVGVKQKLDEAWTNIKGEAATTWVLMRITAVQAFEQLKEAIKSPINGVLSVVQSMINKIISGINSIVDKINSIPNIQFHNPFTGTEYKLGFKLSRLSSITIPRLAQGAVIPPNKEFMAVLGDQKRGTNLEAPESLIRQIVREEAGSKSGNTTVVAKVGRRELFEIVIEEARIRQETTGRNPFDFA